MELPTRIENKIDGILTLVGVEDVNETGVFEQAAKISDVSAGQQVTLTTDSGIVNHIHIRKPLACIGVVQRVDKNVLTILSTAREAGKTTSTELAVDRQHVQVAKSLFNGGPVSKLSISDIAVGDSVMALNARGQAFIINISAPSPTVGTIVSATADSLVVNTPGKVAGVKLTPTKFDVDGTTRYFNEYFGERPEEVKVSEFETNTETAVTAVGSHAVAVVAMYPAAVGRVTNFVGGNLTIKTGRDEDPNPLIRQYVVDGASKILVGVAGGLVNNGKATFYNYLPGGTSADIHIGDIVNLTAKKQHVLSIRIAPVGKRPAATTQTAANN